MVNIRWPIFLSNLLWLFWPLCCKHFRIYPRPVSDTSYTVDWCKAILKVVSFGCFVRSLAKFQSVSCSPQGRQRCALCTAYTVQCTMYIEHRKHCRQSYEKDFFRSDVGSTLLNDPTSSGLHHRTEYRTHTQSPNIAKYHSNCASHSSSLVSS